MIVHGRHAKTRQRRVVDVPANAVEWLRVWKEKMEIEKEESQRREWRRRKKAKKAEDAVEKIIPRNFKRRWERLREGCGWKLPWPHDVMRHTFASMHYAAYANESKLQALMGHESANVLFTNYRALRTPVEAKLFWDLRPGPLWEFP